MASSNSAVKRVAIAPPRTAPRVVPEVASEIRKPGLTGAAGGAKRPKKKKALPTHADSVIDQVKIAFSVSAIGLCIGVVLGASVPLTTYFISHYEWREFWSIYSLLVAGGLIFSANSVYFWTKSAFRSGIKALGFVVLTELGMIFSHIAWISLLGLSILIGINAIASGANLVLKPQVVKKKHSWEN